jgi:hypothetical protein
VKTWAMRGTLHWIEAGDFPVWAAAFATRDHWRKPVWQRAFKMSEADVEAMVEAVTGALDGKLLTRVELADEVHRLLHNDDVDEHLRSGWGSALKLVALHGLLCFGPDKGRNVTFVRPDQWLPDWREVEKDEAIQEVCRRYLASHGPATREEFARWWGFQPANARKVIESLEGEVVEVDRDGDRAYIVRRDLRSLQAVEEDADVRLLGMFDAYTLAGLPHDQIVPKAKKEAVYRKGAWVSQVVMRGGRVVGVWKHDRKPRGTAVEVDLFDRRAATKKQITQELEALEPYIGDIASVTTR